MLLAGWLCVPAPASLRSLITVSVVDLDGAIVLFRFACLYGSGWTLFILVGEPGKVPGAEKPSAVWNEGVSQVLDPRL